MITTQIKPEAPWPDERLIRECRHGNQDAWSALIDKYKNLIFSIPIKFGLSRDEAADVFQAVCMELHVSLPQLRKPKALPKWLMQTSYHLCLRRKKDRLRSFDDIEDLEEAPESTEKVPEQIVHQVEREQIVREAISELPTRCYRMVAMLFFEDPPRPYDQVAQELRLATGSIGFIRGRCLEKLRKILQERGFR